MPTGMTFKDYASYTRSCVNMTKHQEQQAKTIISSIIRNDFLASQHEKDIWSSLDERDRLSIVTDVQYLMERGCQDPLTLMDVLGARWMGF